KRMSQVFRIQPHAGIGIPPRPSRRRRSSPAPGRTRATRAIGTATGASCRGKRSPTAAPAPNGSSSTSRGEEWKCHPTRRAWTCSRWRGSWPRRRSGERNRAWRRRRRVGRRRRSRGRKGRRRRESGRRSHRRSEEARRAGTNGRRAEAEAAAAVAEARGHWSRKGSMTRRKRM
ncbi:hypothetical protein PENTCL1PPCAC_7965, partial [Pristionchus entomophagus]